MGTTPISREGVFTATFMGSVGYVATPIPRLICLEVVEALRSATRQRANVSVMRIEAVVDMADKAVRSMEPGASSNKHAANKPVRTVVAIGRTVVRSIVKVSIGTDWRNSNVNGNLSRNCA